MAIRTYLPLALLALVVLMYTTALRNPFQTEDQATIVVNPDVTESVGLARLWLQDDQARQGDQPPRYRPLAVLSFHLEAMISGDRLNPGQFRLVNIVLLGLVGWWTALWVSRYVQPVAGWLIALLLVTHPTNAQLINQVSARGELLAMAGVVGFAYLQRRANQAGGWRWSWALAALGAAFLALGSGDAGLLLLPVAAIQAWLGKGGKPVNFNALVLPISSDLIAGRYEPAPRRCHLLTAGLLALPVGLYVLGRSIAVGWWSSFTPVSQDLTANPLLTLSLPERLPQAMSLAGFYTRQILWPKSSYNLIPTTPYSWADALPWLGLFMLAGTVLSLLLLLRKRHWLSLAAALGLGQFLLIGNLLAPAPLYASNQWGLPFQLAALLILATLLDRLMGSNLRRRAVAIIPTALLALGMGLWVFLNNTSCSHPQRRRLVDLEQQPGNPVAMFLYAQSLSEQGRYDTALPWLERVVEQRPRSVQARYELANLLLNLGRAGQAVEQYEQVLVHKPNDARALGQLATLALQRGDLLKARELFIQLQTHHPQLAARRRDLQMLVPD